MSFCTHKLNGMIFIVLIELAHNCYIQLHFNKIKTNNIYTNIVNGRKKKQNTN